MSETVRDQAKRYVRLDLIDVFSKANIHVDYLRSITDEIVEELVDMDQQERKQRIGIIVIEFSKEHDKLKWGKQK